MLKLKDVSKYYYQDGVISKGITKVNLELFMGEFVVITGESGSGKSTLLNVLSGLDTYEDGEMYINGEETSHYTEEDYQKYRRKYVSNIFQNFNLVNSYTVYENIELALLMNGKNRKDVKKEVNELIEKVGLIKYRNTKTSKLSGGQKQRVAIARALATNTPVIVADEPTGALDSNASKGILKLLKEISENKLVIVVTHNKKEIEEYATRLIRMHDGKILENKIIKKINLDNEIKENKVKDISFLSKLRLSIKNAFNIPVKFILMFIIFSLISLSLITNYGSFKIAEFQESLTGYNDYFVNTSDKRIIIKKEDKSLFNENDYNNINSIKEIDYIVKDDLLNDYQINLYNDSIYLDGNLIPKNITEVDEGRIPENDNEVVLGGSKKNYYLSDYKNEILNNYFTLSIDSTKKIKVVGIIYINTSNNYTFEYYFSNNILNHINKETYRDNSNTSYIFNKTYDNNIFVTIDNNINPGEIKINETYKNICEENNCIGKTFTINSKNIYYDEHIDFKVTSYYKSKVGYEDVNYVYINENDYNKLYKGNYQSSVFIKEAKDLDNVIKKLNDLGYNTLSMKSAKVDNLKEFTQIFKIIKLIFTIIQIVALFFISYFIIKIIYKSRNSYYTTLRSLGSTKKNCINILKGELFVLATITYILLISLVYLVNKNIINIEYLEEINKYVGIREYCIIYLILIMLIILIANRYGRKIFKDSIIKTYGGGQI